MSGSVRQLRVQPAPPPPDSSMPGQKHKSDRQPESRDHDSFFDLDQVASATECTGILAAQVQNEDEAESVSSLEGIHTIQPPDKNKKRG